MKKANIFIAFTPYHVFLASIIALKNQEFDNVLVVVSDFNADDLVVVMKHSDIFVECIQLPGIYMREKHFTPIRKKNIKTISDIIDRFESLDTLYISNDASMESQATAYKVRRKYPKIVIALIEDGVSMYTSSLRGTKRNFLEIWFNKLKFGEWYENLRVLGTASFVDELHVIFPELVRTEISQKQIRWIDRNICLGENFKRFLEEYWSRYDQEYNKISGIDGLIILANSESGKQHLEYPRLIKNICLEASTRKMKIAIKYHPREMLKDYCELATLPNIVEMSKEIPAEFIYATFLGKMKIIIGDQSTALMTAKWLLGDNIKVYSLARILGRSEMITVFERIDIEVLANNNLEIAKIFDDVDKPKFII